MYIPHIAPHWPIQAKPEVINKYQGKYMKGWEETRKERYKRMIELGILSIDTKLSDQTKGLPNWGSLSEEKKIEMDKRMAIYAAQIDIMDQGIGRIIETLKKQGQFDNTLIVFLSDNGASSENVSRKSNKVEDMGTERSYESIGSSWANTSDTPMRYYKSHEHEGGISTPLIVHWPKGIKTKGALRNKIGHVIDFMPTFVDVAQAKYPESYKNKTILPMEGESLVSTFNNDYVDDRTLFFEHIANRAIRDGDWKLVSMGTRKFPFTSPWELYNLKKDRSETNNLAAKYPNKVKELKSKWNQWAERADVLPLDGRGWDEKITNPTGVRIE